MRTNRHHLAPNDDGWQLSLKQSHRPSKLVPGTRPLLIVPGFGMNANIFGFHPTGRSMEDYLCDAGFEVWSANLRGQGGSRSVGGSSRFGLKELAVRDIGAAIDHILAHTVTGAATVDGIGCSLGATLFFIHATLAPNPKLGALVSMGGALRWEDVHPLVSFAFKSPKLIGSIPVVGSRRLAELALPVLKHTPWLLSIYLNPRNVDLSDVRELARTVENPNRHVNRELAHWINGRDLHIDGRNLTREFSERVRVPLLSVIANGDGIVPRRSALSAHEAGRMEVRSVLEVGTDAVPIGHADMFICHQAEDWVFAPMAEWLRKLPGPECGDLGPVP